MDIDIVIPSRKISRIMESGFRGNSECGAWLLFSKSSISQDIWSKKPRLRYILREIRTFSDRDITSASSNHITFNTESLIRLMKEANNGFEVGFLHGHPEGYDQFSKIDDKNERLLISSIQNRNGYESKLISILVLPNGELRARCWHSVDSYRMCKITVTGTKLYKFDIHPSNKSTLFDRQIRLFGNTFNNILRNLRVVVVGAGGTGSPLAIMLARAGVKRIAIIDSDEIDSTNIHRLHGARLSDIGKSKAVTLANYIKSIGLSRKIVGEYGNIFQKKFRNYLKSADVIFGATDDHTGRILLNRFSYFYETPVIDIGLATAKSSKDKIKEITGRVTILYPGSACLICRDVINLNKASEEALSKNSVNSFENLIREGYISGGGEPEPAFISMTTSVATMAVEELIQLIVNFRHQEFEVTQRFRRFHIPEDRCTLAIPDDNCPICGTDEYWGIGDYSPYLDLVL